MSSVLLEEHLGQSDHLNLSLFMLDGISSNAVPNSIWGCRINGLLDVSLVDCEKFWSEEESLGYQENKLQKNGVSESGVSDIGGFSIGGNGGILRRKFLHLDVLAVLVTNIYL